MKSSRPWRWQRRVLRATLPEGTRIAAELEELFVRRLRSQSPLRAHGWHTRQVIGLMLRAPILWHARRAKGRVAHRDAGRFRWLDDLVQDTRLALRTLLNDRGFAVVAILTLAVAIGANTAIFSVVDAVLLRPLAYPDAEEIVTIGLVRAGETSGVRRDRFLDTAYRHFREQNRSFEEFGAFQLRRRVLIGGGEPTQLSVGLMTNSSYAVLGIPPLRGRLPSEEEDVSDGPSVAVLSNALWVARFGSDPDVIGSTIQLDDRVHEVIGIMPPEFAFPSDEIDVWLPLQLDFEGRGPGTLMVIGRLRDGATLESATTDAEQLIQSFEGTGLGALAFGIAAGRADLQTLKEGIVGDSRQLLLIVLGAASFVLLIACANVANLFLVRAEGRVRQAAVRTALGATRRRLIQHVLTESVILALIGGLGGLVLASIGIRVLVANGPASIPRLDGVGMSTIMFLYTAGVSVLAGLLFGVLPTIRTGSSARVTSALTDGGRGSTGGRDRLRIGGLLVMTEVALALVLLIGSGLMVRSFQELRSVDLGFDPGGVITFALTLPAARYPGPDEQTQFFDQLLGRLRTLPGVEAAGATTYLPLKGGPSLRLDVEEFPASPGYSSPALEARWVTPGYFETMLVPIVSGRTVEPMDHQERLRKVFISASIKEQYWPNTSAIGKRLSPAGWGVWNEVAGVVGDVHTGGLAAAPRPQAVYLTLDFTGPWSALTMSVVVRQARNSLDLVPQLRREVAALDPAIPLTDIKTMDDIVRDSMSRTSFTMFLLVLTAFVAVFLGFVGIYGVISYVVSQRTSELGVRMALGADAADIRSLVLGRGMTWTVIGVALGLGSAALMSRMLTSLLFETSPFDPLTFVAGPIVFLAVAAVACIIPARKAARIDPTEALRSD